MKKPWILSSIAVLLVAVIFIGSYFRYQTINKAVTHIQEENIHFGNSFIVNGLEYTFEKPEVKKVYNENYKQNTWNYYVSVSIKNKTDTSREANLDEVYIESEKNIQQYIDYGDNSQLNPNFKPKLNAHEQTQATLKIELLQGGGFPELGKAPSSSCTLYYIEKEAIDYVKYRIS